MTSVPKTPRQPKLVNKLNAGILIVNEDVQLVQVFLL